MYVVIEVLDSDDDTQMTNLENAANGTETNTLAESTPAVGDKNSQVPKTIATTTAQKVRNRRKSTHQPMRTASPDMHFETIALDDDEEEDLPTNATRRDESQQQKSKPLQKTTPKILTHKPVTIDQLIDAATDEFIAADDTITLLHQIAKERMRTNFLLELCGMPEIHFSLYTQPERLEFQLSSRLKQRKMRNSELLRASSSSKNSVQQTKKAKRSLLHSSSVESS